MTVSKYEAIFHEVSRHATMILPTGKERVHCFICGLRLQFQIETESTALSERSFLDVVDHARTMEELHRRALEGRGKRVHHQGSYNNF